MATTRLGLIGVGVKAYRGFGVRSVVPVTRLTVLGIGGARYLPFLPKAAAEPELPLDIGGGVGEPVRLHPVTGAGFGILPPLEGEAFGVVIVAGVGQGQLPRVGGFATGSTGAAGNSAAQFAIKAAAAGERGQVGAAEATIKGIAAASVGRTGTRGKGFGMIIFEGAAVGEHNDDEAAVLTFLLAA